MLNIEDWDTIIYAKGCSQKMSEKLIFFKQ